MRALSLKDQEKFTSPWAVTDLDEEKFEKTISYLGRLLRDDIQLQALYHMLVMLSPCSLNSSKIQVRSDKHTHFFPLYFYIILSDWQFFSITRP